MCPCADALPPGSSLSHHLLEAGRLFRVGEWLYSMKSSWGSDAFCLDLTSVFMFSFFGHEACGILAPQPGIATAPPALEGKVLTTGLLGKSHHTLLFAHELSRRFK